MVILHNVSCLPHGTSMEATLYAGTKPAIKAKLYRKQQAKQAVRSPLMIAKATQTMPFLLIVDF
jgi:hypothetical protein